MRRGRNVLALVLAGMMALSLCGCSRKTPEEIYQEAAEKPAQMDSMAAVSDIQITASYGEESIDLSINMDIKASGLTSGQLLYEADGSIDVAGQTMNMSYFYADGYYYMDMVGAKLKYPMDLEDMMNQAKQLTGGTSYDLEYIQNLEASEDGDNTILTYNMDGEQMKQLVQELLGGMNIAGATEALEGLDYTFNSIDCQMTINPDGYNTASRIAMDMTMSMDGEEIGFVMDMTTQIENPGETVQVTIPDTSEYQEVIGGAAGMISEEAAEQQ